MEEEISDQMVDGIEGRCGWPVRLFKKGKDNPSSGFQERHEIGEKTFFEKFYPL
jgi:hypothetical protein